MRSISSSGVRTSSPRVFVGLQRLCVPFAAAVEQISTSLGFDAGQAVTVAATDHGSDAVSGTLVGITIKGSIALALISRAK